MDQQTDLKTLYQKLISREISDADLQWLLDYFNTSNLQDLHQMIRRELDLKEGETNEAASPKEITVGTDVYARLHEEINKEQFQTRTTKLWPKIAIAAAIATLMVSMAIWFFNGKQTDPNNTENIAYKNDVNPGKQGATLTLAGGKKIRLSDAANGTLAQQSGVTITKTASGQLIYEIKGNDTQSDQENTLTTDNGETYQVRLPDGSSVWLNAASTLTYPASFAKQNNRSVELSGEGYFEIAKDKLHPFIVKTGNQQVEVLGTHFNINAYKDEPIVATTLLEGSVKVSTATLSKTIKPGEQAINTGQTINTTQVNLESITDWKDGDFVLSDLSFKAAMRKIARWYDVEVIYDSSVPDELETGGWISRNTKLSEVLTLIEKSGLAQFKIEGKKLYVSRKKQ